MREKALQKRLSRHPGCQSHEQTTLLRPRHFLISRSWFLSVLLKSGDFSFASLTNRLSLLLTISAGHVGDAHIKPLRDCVITSAEALSPLIYNCRTNKTSVPLSKKVTVLGRSSFTLMVLSWQMFTSTFYQVPSALESSARTQHSAWCP